MLSQVTKQVEDHKKSLVGLFMTQSLNGVQSGRFHGREKPKITPVPALNATANATAQEGILAD